VAFDIFLLLFALFLLWLASHSGVWQMLTPVRHESWATTVTRLAPIEAISAAWANALRMARRRNPISMILLAIFAFTPLLDLVVSRILAWGLGRQLAVSIVWAVIKFGLLGMVAIRLHWFAVGRFDDAPSWSLRIVSACWFVAMALATNAITYVLANLVPHLPPALVYPGTISVLLLPQSFFSIFIFLRPALSLELNPPLRSALMAFWSKPLLVWAVVVALAFPLPLLNLFLTWVVSIFWRAPPDLVYAVNNALVALFNVLNFSAFEMATATMLVNLQSKWTEIPAED